MSRKYELSEFDSDPVGKWGNFLRFSPFWVIPLILLALLVFFISGLVVVPPKKMAILVKKTGRDIPGGQILALKPEQKGIQLVPLTEGWYWKNPYTWDWVIRDQVEIPKGKMMIRVRMFGKDLPPGQIVADLGTEEQRKSEPWTLAKGILPTVEKAGRYPINPFAFKHLIMDQVNIPPGHRGVVYNLSGKLPKDPRSFVVEEGERGVMERTLPSGKYTPNPYMKRVIPVNLRSHAFHMQGSNAINFPSQDGFNIQMDIFIEWAIDPTRLATVYVKYVDSRDVITCIIEKVVLPQVRAFTRLEGSSYPAAAYIGEKRIEFQKKFETQLEKNCRAEGILIKSALIKDVKLPPRVERPLKDRVIAKQTANQYIKEQEREKEQKKFSIEKFLGERYQLKEKAEKRQKVVKKKAEEDQQVAITQAEKRKKVAEEEAKAALYDAEAQVRLAAAKARAIYLQNEAQAAALKESSSSFGGGEKYVRYLFNQKIAPSISYILSNTDGPFSDMFREVIKKNDEKDYIPDATQPVIPDVKKWRKDLKMPESNEKKEESPKKEDKKD